MDIGHAYSTLSRVRAVIYAEPQFEVPPTLTLKLDGMPVEFFLLADRSLRCGAVDGVSGSCESWDCHRIDLGKCQCGRHPSVSLSRAVRS